MAYSDPGAVTGGTTPARATWANAVRDDVVDHETRISAMEDGQYIVLTADPATPANDTWWVVRDPSTSPEFVSIKARIAGHTITIVTEPF